MVIREGMAWPVCLSVTLTLRDAENISASGLAFRVMGPTSISSVVLGRRWRACWYRNLVYQGNRDGMHQRIDVQQITDALVV